MLRRWRLGSLFGIGLYVHPTFLLLPLLLLWQSYQAGLGAVLFLEALLLAVFGCVVLHELGHALTARRYGIGTVDITLYPIGGVARLARTTGKPVEELWIALAGPAVNVVIAAGLTPVYLIAKFQGLLGGSMEEALQAGGLPLAATFVEGLWFANVVLVLFNMLPSFPMDGGRVLRALLAMRLEPVRATAIAVFVGRVVLLAGLLLLWRFLPEFLEGNPMLPILAVFVILVGQMELTAMRRREVARRAAVLPAVLPPADCPVEPGFSGVTWDHRSGIGIHWQDGRPVSTFVVPVE
jgi:Zn-dependent protease